MVPASSHHDTSPVDRGPFVFLDRDGTIIEDRHYLADPDGVVLMPGAIEGLRLLREAGRRLVVVTNQSGIGRGLFTEAQMHAVHARLRAVLRAGGVELDAICWCPHGPEAACTCRKPATGQIERALAELGGSLAGAAVIGDRAADIQLARNAGITAVLVGAGTHPQDTRVPMPEPDLRAMDLLDAVRQLLARQNPAKHPA
jgi:D-glycero-D-manno-heptose 1,7-bisphosphate phosphatase